MNPMDVLSDRSPQTFFAQHTGVRFIRFQWIDLSGILRTRMVTRQHCEHLIESAQFLTVSVTLMLFPVSALQISKTPATGCAELRPNWASLRICMYTQAHASVMCSFYVRGADHPYSLCPHSTLEGVLHKAETAFNKTFLVGFEVEFLVLTDKYESIVGVNQITTNSTTSGLRGKLLEALERIVSILEGSGITVQTVHTEGPSQLEIATGPLPPLEAIASLVYTHETIKTVFASYDLHATMAPSVSSDGTTTGAHVHISMSQP
ncbi:hypothetical protein BKA63DRAFT_192552 [Paraphoma chrysanthemicola]|nr:hypothetical protein BKA63DRAFT_192552 [Paraphoma chrysanthemicola]